jgi:hypothetical protein
MYQISTHLAVYNAILSGFRLRVSKSSGLDHLQLVMAEPAQNAQGNAREEEALLNKVWSIGQKVFLAWAISQLGMR